MNLETLKIVITAQTNQITSEVAKAQKALGGIKNKNVVINTKVNAAGVVGATSSVSLLTQLFDRLNISGGTFIGTLTDMAQAFSTMNVAGSLAGSAAAKIMANDAELQGLNLELSEANKNLVYIQANAAKAAKKIDDLADAMDDSGQGGPSESDIKHSAYLDNEVKRRKEIVDKTEKNIVSRKKALGVADSEIASLGVMSGLWQKLLGLAAKYAVALGLIALALAPVLAMMAAIGIGNFLQRQAQQAITFDSSLKRVQTSLGEMSDSTNKWAQDNAMAMGMSKDAAVSLLATYSQIAASFTKNNASQAAAAKNLTNLTAVIASKTGRTQQDVGERLRSGMMGNTESAEDIGINVSAKKLDMQTAAIYGQKTAYQDLGAEQQAYIRYMALMTQGAKQYGTTVQSGAALASAQWTATLGNLKLALSEAFLPIATTVLPALAKFITWIGAAFMVVWKLIIISLQFFGLIGKINGAGADKAKAADDNVKSMGASLGGAKVNAGGVASGLGKAAKAAKEIRKSLAGFDEINNLGANPTDAASGGSGGAGGGGGGIGDLPIPDITSGLEDGIKLPSIEDMSNRFIKWWNGIWTRVGETKLAGLWYAFGSGMAEALMLGTQHSRNAWKILWNQVKTQYAIAGALVKSFTVVFKNVWKATIEYLKSIWSTFDKFFGTVWANIKALFSGSIGPVQFFKNVFKAALDAVKSIWNATGTYFGTIWTNVKTAFSAVKTFFTDTFKNGYNAMVAQFKNTGSYFGGLMNIIKDKFKGLGVTLGSSIGTGFKNVMNDVLRGIESTINRGIININNMLRAWNALPGTPNASLLGYVSLPRLAKGGVVGSGQIYQAGEAGKEAIVPLENNTEWIGKIASELNAGMGGRNDKPLTIILQVGQTEFGRVAVNSINALTMQEGALALNI